MAETSNLEREQLERLARIAVANRIPVNWTDGKAGDDAKRARRPQWQKKSKTFSELGSATAEILTRAKTRNPIVVFEQGGHLLSVDLDSEEDVAWFRQFAPPATVRVRSGKGEHLWYLRPEGFPYSAIYVEHGSITPKRGNYLVAPGAIHPSGAVYQFATARDELAEFPLEVANAIVEASGKQKKQRDATLAADPGAKVTAGGRHKLLQEEAGKLAKTTLTEEACFQALWQLNLDRCDPPKDEEEVRSLARAAAGEWRESDVAREMALHAPGSGHDYSSDYKRVADEKSRHVPWLDKPFLQAAAFQILAAKGSTGKGLWTAHLASQLTRGLLPGQSSPSSIAFISSEDNVSQDVKPRLQAAGADLERCYVVTRQFMLPRDTRWLEGLIDHLELGAVVIDPVANHIGGVDGNDEAAIREALAKLNDVADEHDCLVLGVRHMRKDADSGALAAVLGSTAWVDLPRNVIIMVRDPEDTSVVYQDVLKQNRAAMGDTGRVYQISGVDITLDDGVEDNIGLMRPALDIDFKDLDSIVGKRKNTAKRAIEDTIIELLRNATGREMYVNELDSLVVSRVGAAKGTVENVRSRMTAGMKGKDMATEERPLLKIVPPQSAEDQRRRVVLEWGVDDEATEVKKPDEW